MSSCLHISNERRYQISGWRCVPSELSGGVCGTIPNLMQRFCTLCSSCQIVSRLWSEIEFGPEAEGFPMDRRATLPVGRKQTML
jgi:hypothetical protein